MAKCLANQAGRWQQCCGCANGIFVGDNARKEMRANKSLAQGGSLLCGQQRLSLLLFIGYTWVGGATLCSIYQILSVYTSPCISQSGRLKWPAGSVWARLEERVTQLDALGTRHSALKQSSFFSFSIYLCLTVPPLVTEASSARLEYSPGHTCPTYAAASVTWAATTALRVEKGAGERCKRYS